MSDLTRARTLRYGKHASNQDWTATPGALKFIRPVEPVVFDPGFQAIPRPWQVQNNENLASLRGLDNTEIGEFTVPVFGLSGGGAGDGVDTSTLDTSISELLEIALGSTEVDNEGDTTGSAGSGTSVEIDATPVTPISNGGGLAVAGTTSGKLVAREVVSFSDPNYTVDRALTEDDNTADTSAAASTVFAARTYFPDNDAQDHIHGYLDAEGENERRTFAGCLWNLIFRFASGQVATVTAAGIQGTQLDQNATEADPTYSAPTEGSELVVHDSPFWIGSDAFMASDLELDVGAEMVRRRSDGAPNGHWGFVTSNIMARLTGRIRFGALTAPKEATDALLATWRGTSSNAAPTFDVSFQVGRSAGAMLYCRIPAFRFNAAETRLVDEDGLTTLQFQGEATERSDQATIPGSFRLHLF